MGAPRRNESGLLAVIRKSISPRSSRSPSSAGRRLGQADVRGQLAAEAVGAALHPFVARLDAVFVLQQPAHVDGGGHAVFGTPPRLPLRSARMRDALAGVDEEVAVAKTRDGNTGMAMNGALPPLTSVV